MITVTIAINGTPIFTRSAVNVSPKNQECCRYITDAGDGIHHDTEDGAVVLAIKMLNTIKEEEMEAVNNGFPK